MGASLANDLVDYVHLPGFDVAMAWLLGDARTGDTCRDLEAAHATGLRYPWEVGVVVPRTEGDHSARFANVATVLGVAACHVAGDWPLMVPTTTGRRPCATMPGTDDTDMARYVSRTCPKTVDVGEVDGKRTVFHVEPKAWLVMTACTREGDDVSVETRHASLTATGAWAWTGEGWLGLPRRADVDATLLDAWRRGMLPAGVEAPRVRQPPETDLSMRRELLDALGPAEEVAFRRFARAAWGPATEVALTLPMGDSHDVDAFRRAHDAARESGRPDWVLQAVLANPGYAAMLAACATRSGRGFAGDGWATDVILDATDAIGSGTPPVRALVQAFDKSGEVRLSHPGATSLAAFDGTDFTSRLRPCVEALEATLRGTRHRPKVKHHEVMVLLRTGDLIRSCHDPLGKEPACEVDYHDLGEALRDGSVIYPPPENWQDALRWLVTKASACGVPGARAPTVAQRLLFRPNRQAAGVEETLARWHERVDALDATEAAVRLKVLADACPNADLSTLFPELPLDGLDLGGVSIRQLRSSEDCAAEGREMSHCVATFSDRAAVGEVVLLSLTGMDGRSTAALVVGRHDVAVEQVRGRANAMPSREHVLAAKVVADATTGRRRALLTKRIDLATLAHRAITAAEADLSAAAKEALADAAFRSLSTFMTRSERAAGLFGLLAREPATRRRGTVG